MIASLIPQKTTLESLLCLCSLRKKRKRKCACVECKLFVCSVICWRQISNSSVLHCICTCGCPAQWRSVSKSLNPFSPAHLSQAGEFCSCQDLWRVSWVSGESSGPHSKCMPIFLVVLVHFYSKELCLYLNTANFTEGCSLDLLLSSGCTQKGERIFFKCWAENWKIRNHFSMFR